MGESKLAARFPLELPLPLDAFMCAICVFFGASLSLGGRLPKQLHKADKKGALVVPVFLCVCVCVRDCRDGAG